MPSIAPRHLAEKVDRLAEQALDFFAEKELLAELHREPVEAVSQLLDALDGAKHVYHRTLLRRVWQELPEAWCEAVAAVVIERALNRSVHTATRTAALDLLVPGSS